MGKKIITLSSQGQRVMGALASFLAPRMAADQSLQSVELEALCKSISPGRYDRQIEGIVGTVKERFASRLAADQKLDDLRKILTALMPADLALDKKKEDEEVDDEDDDSNDDDSNDSKKGACDDMDSEDAEFKAWKKAKDKKKAADAKKAKDKKGAEDEDDEDGDGGGEDAANKNKNDPDLKNEEGDMDDNEEEQWVKTKKPGHANGQDKKAKDAFPSKKALDQALDAAREEGAELAISRLGARFEAAALVKPVIGRVDPHTTSATRMYKMALDEMAKTRKGIDLSEIPPLAYKGVFKALMANDSARSQKPNVRLAQDSASAKTLNEKYTNIPGLA
jgi:hypothetical protein